MATKTIEFTKEVEEDAEEFGMDQSGYIHGVVRQRDADGNVLAEAQVTLVPDLDIESTPALAAAVALIKAAIVAKAEEKGPTVRGKLLTAAAKP